MRPGLQQAGLTSQSFTQQLRAWTLGSHVSALPLAVCVTSGELLNLFVPLSFHLYKGGIMALCSEITEFIYSTPCMVSAI